MLESAESESTKESYDDLPDALKNCYIKPRHVPF